MLGLLIYFLLYAHAQLGKDASAAFAGVGHSKDAIELRDSTYLIGRLASSQPAATKSVDDDCACHMT